MAGNSTKDGSFQGAEAFGHSPEGQQFLGMDLRESDRMLLRAAENKRNVIVRPGPKIGIFSVACIIANRMIGTGIFDTPTTILQQDHKIGPSLLLWFACCCASLAGTLVYIEYGLTVPRWIFAKQRSPTPRNGGELVYLQHVLRNFRRFFASCLFGIPFILVGNSAPNAISFAYHFLLAIGSSTEHGHVQGVAIAASALICLIHGLWRRWGITVNNVFASVKMLILIVIFFLAVAVVAGYQVYDRNAVPESCPQDPKPGSMTAADNLSPATSFDRIGGPSSGVQYAMAYLQIIFTFGGWNQANYVLGEIRDPFRNFKRTSLTTVAMISVMYILTNISYLMVVPVKDNPDALDIDKCPHWNLAQKFLGMTTKSNKTYYWILTVSSLGNIVVTTFTAARVKQEIARSGILPWSQNIANNYDIIMRLKNFVRRKLNADTPEVDRSSEATPALALVVHFVFTVILILATLGVNPVVAYGAILSIYSYSIDAFFAFCLGLGLLWLRASSLIRKKIGSRINDPNYEDWNEISAMPAWVSVPAASLMVVSNLFPLVALWVPGSSDGSDIPGKVVYATGLSLLASGIVYWAYFVYIRPQGKVRVVKRTPIFAREARDHDHPVQQFEIFEIKWARPDAQEEEEEEDYELNSQDSGGIFRQRTRGSETS